MGIHSRGIVLMLIDAARGAKGLAAWAAYSAVAES